uniref:Uncharacterized protein n=1 Tax=Amphilophus citrinellus TaxID=61819 RepID=A0A3Q0T502_AMPCI
MNSPRGQLQFSKALMMISVLGGLFLCRAAANISADLEETKSKDRSFIWTKTNADANLISLSDQNDTESLHYYKNGRENLDHQSLSFKNRTRIFPKELPSGNLSLLINPLMLKDDQKSLKVVVITDSIRSICQSIIHVAGLYRSHFRKPWMTTEVRALLRSRDSAFKCGDTTALRTSRSVHTTMLQNSHSRLFSSHSTLRIPAGAHEAVSCLSHNPILNRTVMHYSNIHILSHYMDGCALIKTISVCVSVCRCSSEELTWRSDSSCCGSSNSSAAAVTHSTVADT